MEIKYQASITDHYAASKHTNRKFCLSTKWRYLSTFACGVFGFSLAVGCVSIIKFYEKYDFLPKEKLNFGLSAIIIGTLILFVGSRLYNSKARPLIFNQNGLFLAPRLCRIESNHLYIQLGDSQHIYQWKYVNEIEQTKDYIFIFIDRSAALYIPRHGFNSDEQYNEFFNTLNSHVQLVD